MKNVVLVLILGGALLGNLSLLILDPVALLTRSISTEVLPAINYGVTEAERAAYSLRILRPVFNWVEGVLRGPVLPVIQPAFAYAAAIAALFGVVLGLNAVADRFWCCYL